MPVVHPCKVLDARILKLILHYKESLVGIIAWIVLGAIAGFIANMIMGSREGLVMMIVLGIVGAVVGGFIAGTVLKVADVTGLNIESLVVAVFGAIVVIFVARRFGGSAGRRTV